MLWYSNDKGNLAQTNYIWIITFLKAKVATMIG